MVRVTNETPAGAGSSSFAPTFAPSGSSYWNQPIRPDPAAPCPPATAAEKAAPPSAASCPWRLPQAFSAKRLIPAASAAGYSYGHTE